MIEAFGQFVVGGNYVVGFVLFLALIAIQYLVVSHGAVRTAEVTARFTLDAMPGKQMAIDADLNAGLIDEKQARRAASRSAREAEFYGAMDGAARFSQRDSLATMLITAINIIAGFLIGVFQLGIPFRDALEDLHHPDRGRRSGDHDPVAAGLGGRRHRGDPRLLRRQPGRRCRQAAVRAQPSAVDCRRGDGRAGPDSRAAEDFLSLPLPAGVALLARRAKDAPRGDKAELPEPPPAGRQCAGGSGSQPEALEALLKLDDLAWRSATVWCRWSMPRRAGSCCSG